MLLKRRLGKGNNLLGQILQYRPSVQGDIELLSGWQSLGWRRASSLTASSDIRVPRVPRPRLCYRHPLPPPHRRGSPGICMRYPRRRDIKAAALATAPGSSTPVAPCAAPHAARQDGGLPRSVAAAALPSPVPPLLPPVPATVAPDEAQGDFCSCRDMKARYMPGRHTWISNASYSHNLLSIKSFVNYQERSGKHCSLPCKGSSEAICTCGGQQNCLIKNILGSFPTIM